MTAMLTIALTSPRPKALPQQPGLRSVSNRRFRTNEVLGHSVAPSARLPDGRRRPVLRDAAPALGCGLGMA